MADAACQPGLGMSPHAQVAPSPKAPKAVGSLLAPPLGDTPRFRACGARLSAATLQEKASWDARGWEGAQTKTGPGKTENNATEP